MSAAPDRKDQLMDSAAHSDHGTSEGCSCAEARDHLDAFLDHEAGQEVSERLARHVASCAHCSRLADAEKHLRAILRECCGAEQAPPELRARVMSALTVMRTTASVTTVRSVRTVLTQRVERG